MRGFSRSWTKETRPHSIVFSIERRVESTSPPRHGSGAEDLSEEGRNAIRVVVKVRFAPFFTSSHGVRLTEPTIEPAAIEQAALEALARFDLNRPVRLLGVRADLAGA